MEKKKAKVVASILALCLLGLGYFLFSRYVVSRLDGTGRIDAPEDITPRATQVLFVGDIMLDRTVRTTIATQGFDYVFGDIKTIFEGTDLAIGNLEGSVTERPSVSQADHSVLRFTFATSTAFELKGLGFTGFSLANNHALDIGEFGLSDTEHYLQNAGLYFFGSPYNDRNLVSMPRVHDESICFIGYHQLFESSISPVIRELNEQTGCDYTVVFAHWGEEYQTKPSESQRKTAHAFIDAGADLVIGAHPHVIQPVEIYGSRAIFYSLGNFIFDQDFSLPTRQGLAVRLGLSSTTQRFHLIGIEMSKNRLYFPEKESFRPSMETLVSELPEDLRKKADVDGELVLPR